MPPSLEDPSLAWYRESPSLAAQGKMINSIPATLERSAIPEFLATYGWKTRDADASDWWPFGNSTTLFLKCTGTADVDGHRWYMIEGILAKAGEWHKPLLTWTILRRMSHLRTGLHDVIKNENIEKYRAWFEDTAFEHRLDIISGSEAQVQRLDLWLRKLAKLVSSRGVPPYVAALTLRMVGTPEGFVMPDDETSVVHDPASNIAGIGGGAPMLSVAAGDDLPEGQSSSNPFSAPTSAIDTRNPFNPLSVREETFQGVPSECTADDIGDGGTAGSGLPVVEETIDDVGHGGSSGMLAGGGPSEEHSSDAGDAGDAGGSASANGSPAPRPIEQL
mmetsp:Transcript_81158/g.180479  ORF Transcript_81158/g.180479 Transcript_81158/m.180479 type:complete len:333 (+) Transcript_81158:143-1141(+)